jgi:hypothetical protein
MTIDVKLDPEMIDYEAINKKIQEKIDALDIKDYELFNHRVEDAIEDQIYKATKSYIETRWGYYNDPARGDNIKSQARDDITDAVNNAIKNHVNQSLNDLFDHLPEDFIENLFVKIFPHVMESLIRGRIQELLTAKRVDLIETARSNTERAVQMYIDQALHRY